MGITEIKSCPFCGEYPEHNTSIMPYCKNEAMGSPIDHIKLETSLSCKNCECIKRAFINIIPTLPTIAFFDYLNELDSQVIEQWNTRKE